MLSEVLYAARISLSVGVAAALISTILGALVGIVAGYFGGWVDRVLMAIDDWVLVIPFIPTAIVIASLLGRRADDWPLGRESVLVLVIGALGWAGTSRIVRSQVLTLKERDYVQRARVLGLERPHDHVPPHPARRPAARARQRRALRLGRRAGRDDARVPRPRRPAATSPGARCSTARTSRAR